MSEKIEVKTSAQSVNNQVAAENREVFAKKGLTVLNLVSSAGSGKTFLLEVMAKRYGPEMAVITGDIQMTYDADRISAAGSQAVQIETHGTCHLTAAMVQGPAGGFETGESKVVGDREHRQPGLPLHLRLRREHQSCIVERGRRRRETHEISGAFLARRRGGFDQDGPLALREFQCGSSPKRLPKTQPTGQFFPDFLQDGRGDGRMVWIFEITSK